MSVPSRSLQWHKDNYLVSTDPKLLSLDAINKAFADPAVYWTNPVPLDVLQATLNNSLCFGLYDTTKPDHSEAKSTTTPMEHGSQIGLARLITDHVSFAYLTDVYVKEGYQGKGLGTWLIGCIREWTQERPYFRALTLLTTNEKAIDLYGRLLGTEIDEHLKLLIWKGPRAAV